MATSNKTATIDAGHGHGGGATRRDFLFVATAATGAVGMGAAIWPFLDNLNPAADTLALASVEISLAGIEPGQSITVKWRGKPVFVRRRTADDIKAAQADDGKGPDPQKDADRVKKGKEEWLVLVGVCTHLGCIPGGQEVTENKGDYKGWYCPCHGSHYDTSGRIRKGPAPKNLEVPDYAFLNDTTLRVG
jgi:ubiquinol-cytochrome c reductase iron-sulfur subunit